MLPASIRASAPAIAALLIAGLAPLPLLAGDGRGDRDDRRDRGREGKQEFWDGPCKVEVEWKRNGDYKHERKCQGGAEQFAERKEEFRDAGCKIKREWKKNGDFLEERQCDGRPGGRHGPGPVAVVYPPWVVLERGEPVYRPGREPAPPSRPSQPAARCQSEAVGRILGGIAGAVIGSQLGKDGARTVATIGGAVAGVLIGGEIGRRIDAGNQACIGQALEFGATGQRVVWSDGSRQYAVVPGAVRNTGQGPCRDYVVETLADGGWQGVPARACRGSDGVWAAAPR